MTRNSVSNRKRRRTKRTINRPVLILVVLGAILIVGAGFLLLPKDKTNPNYTPEVTGGPSLKADKQHIDFGDVRFNEYVTASFKLTNVGDESLKFTQQPYVELKAGC